MLGSAKSPELGTVHPFQKISSLKNLSKNNRHDRFRNNLIIMSVGSNRAVCARRLVQEKLCNFLFNNQQKCATLTSKRNLGTTVSPQSTQSSSFTTIHQNNSKFGSFLRHSQVSNIFVPDLYESFGKFRNFF